MSNRMMEIQDGNNRFRARWEKAGADAMQVMYQQSISTDPNLTKIVVWDGENSLDLRRAIYPEYKGNKKPSPENFHETMELYKEVLRHSNCIQISLPGYEADDVIRALAVDSNKQIVIDSNDADFLVLVNDRISVTREEMPNVQSQHIPIYKALVGDKSDNIPGLKGFGEGTWAKLSAEQIGHLENHFNNTHRLTSVECKELLGFTKGLVNKWDESVEALDMYYKVIQFIPINMELIGQHLEFGVYDQAKAMAVLLPFLQ